MSRNTFLRLHRPLLIAAGTVSCAIGVIGIFVPLLPTTPFLLLAAACYLRSSEPLYRKLLKTRILGAYIGNYIKGREMTPAAKAFTLILLWCGIGTAMAIATQSLLVRIVLGLIACAVSWHVITIRTKRREPPPVAQVFDRIAPSWYNYRHHSIFTAELEALAGRWQKGRLLNVGCGHGADFLPFKEGFELHGIDISAGMLHQARRFAAKYRLDVSLVRGDAVCLPYADGSFDHAIAVATYHHIPREADRLMALRELYRVLRPGAEAFITCWHRWQVRFWLKQRDVLVPWRTEEGVFYRYYHLFSFGELERLVKQAGFRLITSHAESRHRSAVRFLCRNVCVLVRKE